MTLANSPRYDPARVTRRDGHAVVVGASVAGLLAGRVLSDGFADVTVIDKDPLPDEPVARKSVPQADHPHLMLEAGRATIEDLFPGYSKGLLDSGALLLDHGTDLKIFLEGDFMADADERLPMYAASRPLFEHQIRTRLEDVPGVDLRRECTFVDYLSEDGRRIDGIRIRENGTEREIRADLVVDATGRTSRTPDWLESHGFDSPAVDEVKIDMAYSTTRFERPEDARWSLGMLPDAPRKRGWAVVPIENGEWLVTLSEIHGEQPPTTPEEFTQYIADMPTDVGRRFVDEYEFSTSEIEAYPYPSNIRRRYEDLDSFPEGLIVVGDAITSFNPIYGQGMSVAALESLMLHDCLADSYRTGVATEFFTRAEPVIDVAWQMATGADFEFDETTGKKPTGLWFFNWYMARLIRKAHNDSVLRTAFGKVLMMKNPPTSLFNPRIFRRVMSPKARTTGGTVDPVKTVGPSGHTSVPGHD